MDNLTQLEILLVKEMMSQDVASQTILMIMEVLTDKNAQEKFGDFLVSIRDQIVPEWKLIVAANMISEELSFNIKE